MTPCERDTLETILRDVATFNQRQIGKVRVDRIKLLIPPGVAITADMTIEAVELLPTGARCA